MGTQVRKLLLATSALVPIALVSALANPLDGRVVGGSASIQGQGTSQVTVTQSTNRAIINWNTFNIGNGELTRFLQPNSGSIALNRVTGGLGASQLYGTLIANGRIFLVNHDGILVGPGAKIDTAGFLATTNDITNRDFMRGRYNFTIPGRPDASIVNLGNISASSQGFAALVAPGVRNSGTITANLGRITLASGNTFTLDFYGDNLIKLAVSDSVAGQVKDAATGQPLRSILSNDGILSANGGRIVLNAVTARQVVDSVINNTGVIEANSIGLQNGMIVLQAPTAATKLAGSPTQTVNISGTISAAGNNPGETGGRIQITGEAIALQAARLDASGRAGGGAVLVGGDTGGGKVNPVVADNPKAALEARPVPTATTVTVDSASVIDASAKQSGDGGKVIVWSDGSTKVAGEIFARGGLLTGNGGFVETSGHALDITGAKVDTTAPYGRTGTWLLDPYDLIINYAAATTISSNLATSNVTVLTTASSYSGPGTATPGNGDIEVASSMYWNSGNSLTISAYRNLTVNDGVTIANTANGNLALKADNARTYTGIVNFNGNGKVDFSQSSGTVSIYTNVAATIAVLANYSVPNQVTVNLPSDPVAYMTGTVDPWSPASGSVFGGCGCVVTGNPGSNDFAMNVVFGAGNWTKFQGFNTGPLNSAYRFVFIDGGNGISSQFNSFISANITALQNYVSAGGTLFINGGRWTNGTIPFTYETGGVIRNLNVGFGTTLQFTNAYLGTDPFSIGSFTGRAVDPTHAIFQGPNGSAGTSWSGVGFSFDVVVAPALTSIIVGDHGTVLAGARYGSGYVMVGGMTAPFFHSPQTEANNLRANILSFVDAQYGLVQQNNTGSTGQQQLVLPPFCIVGAACGPVHPNDLKQIVFKPIDLPPPIIILPAPQQTPQQQLNIELATARSEMIRDGSLHIEDVSLILKIVQTLSPVLNSNYSIDIQPSGKYIYPPNYANLKDECVALVRALTNLPDTTQWTAGIQVYDQTSGLNSALKPGTPIATFEPTYTINGILRYPGADGRFLGPDGKIDLNDPNKIAHTMIFLSAGNGPNGERGMFVLDQAKIADQPANIRFYPFSNANISRYYAIQTTQ